MNKQIPMSLQEQIITKASRLHLSSYLLTQPLVLGVSGGADSLAMLHILCALRGEAAASTLHVAHLNHWFRGKEAHEDAEFVRDTASAWGLSCTIETFDVPNYARRFRLSQEDAARRVRYAFLASLARERGAAVAVAHNADDQVETVLMSILRGTGIGGLAGMQMLATVPEPAWDDAIARFNIGEQEDKSKVPLFRPLLHIWRHEILDYCKEEKLEPRFDSTNWERAYKRNRVRHDLIPHLQMQYSLAVKSHLYNLAQIAHGENELLDDIVEQQWHQVVSLEDGGRTVRFQCSQFAALPEAMRRRLARRAIFEIAGTLKDITFEHIEVVSAILAGEPGSPAAMHLPHKLVASSEGAWASVKQRAGGSLVEPSELWPAMQNSAVAPIEPEMNIVLEGGWQFDAYLLGAGEATEKPGELVALFDYDALLELGIATLRTRREGDFIQPLGMAGRKTLQDVMINAKIPRELRSRVPIIAPGDSSEVLWVPGKRGRRSGHATVTSSTERVLQLRFSRLINLAK